MKRRYDCSYIELAKMREKEAADARKKKVIDIIEIIGGSFVGAIFMYIMILAATIQL